MYPLARIVLSSLKTQIRSMQQMKARDIQGKYAPDFHDKYGNIILLSGTTFCVATWFYTITQIGVQWNLSPVGRVTPREWNEE
ncbi:cytochrome c oxidase subunit 7B2, mitochondrial [Erinaceus europaeus]|uniref:Cytochrome c oxidase subunit 7B2, mitochondrial n=1 Tax=Erinaceus europaeus TaxID=9365 RepID=A0A1S3AS38_ERIEU|nr:cytochrome c oxidase subunit 7B2, mitochondrial [Erinaceus europaeus]XP_060044612.1 cytochrome c oxidase subunit 7B2, mitochondrial [Erinaceus europaeus]